MMYQIFVAFLLTACAGSNKQASTRTPPRSDTPVTKGGSDIRLSAESWGQIADINERYGRFLKNAATHASLSRVNQALCTRLETMRQKCVVRKPLIKDILTKSLACDGTLKDAVNPAQFSVELAAPPGVSFKLEANDLFTSTSFKAGTTNISFSSPSDDNRVSPSFAAVYKLTLKSPPQPLNSSVTLTLKVDGETIISGQTLHNSASDPDKFVVDLTPVFGMSTSGACRVSDEEYAAMVNSATIASSETEGKLAIDVKTLKTTPSSENLNSTLNEVSSKLGEMVKSIEMEIGRNLRLRNELMTGSGEGCHLRKPIERLSVELSGPGRGRTYVGRRDGRLTSTTSSSSATLQIDIGNIRIDIPTDSQNPFGSVHEVDRDVSQTDIIAGIDRLVFRKLGLKFTNIGEPCNTNGGVVDIFGRLISNPTCYRVHEDDTMHITGIKLFANNKLIFEDDKLDVRLDRTRTNWTYPKSIHSNEQWIKEVVKKTDCDDTN